MACCRKLRRVCKAAANVVGGAAFGAGVLFSGQPRRNVTNT